MMTGGYKGSDLKKLKALLNSNHQISIGLTLMDLDHTNQRSVSNRMLTGQVNFDINGDVIRTLDLELSDPNSALSINPDNPSGAAMFMNTMIRVIYGVADPMGSKWYYIPVFTGPITNLERDTFTVKISAQGKDVLAYSSVWKAKTFAGNALMTSIIRFLVTEIIGESATKAVFPTSTRRTPKKKKTIIDIAAVPMKVLKTLSKSLGCEVFYDGRGVLQIRKWSGKSVITYNGRNITTLPKYSYDPSTIINAVRVIGGKPKGAKKKIDIRLVAPKTHPLNPYRLGRNKKGRFYTMLIQDDAIKSKKQAKALASRELKKGLQQSLNVEFSALPNPMQEEGDVIHINVDDTRSSLRPAQWSLPLTHDGTSTIGKVQKVSFRSVSRGHKKGQTKRK